MLSSTRILLGLLFLFFLLKGRLGEGLLVFILGVFSDKLDGFLARRFRVESEAGKVVDPVSDRIFVALAFLALYFAPLKIDVSWWAVLLTVGQDIALAPVGAYATLIRHRVKVSILGKLVTFYQYLFVMLVLFLNLLDVSLNLLPFELLLITLNLLSAGHHVYLWLLKGKNGAS
ncbi:CDP-alcohol phosphatidyltransferase family protein [Hydrogenobacter sp. Uz 6-8]|uniref:CDP-alcohol phosphatidyltransferase family protein n=1 Tax=Hydrogenobacter sp. Uz 6-8 TaxID=3384828 RepID=UPI0038FD2B98